MMLIFPAIFLCSLLCALPTWSDSSVFFVDPPIHDSDQADQVFEAIELRVMLPLGFNLVPDDSDLDTPLANLAEVIDSQTYIDATGTLVEIALVEDFNAFSLVFYCTNSILAQGIHNRLRLLIQRSHSSMGNVSLSYEMFRLGYIEADHAIALLKALGYHTIEFAPARDEGILELVEGNRKELPWIVKTANASKTSLLQAEAGNKGGSSRSKSSKNIEGAPKLGGSHLHEATAGAPEERLFIVYDRYNSEPLEKLVNLLQTHIDLPARQIVIEALVIEANTNRLRDLGVEFSSSQENVQASFQQKSGSTKSFGSLILSPNRFGDFNALRGALEALAETGDAEILSSPSVLVLNDRQARIQVGRQIPVARTTAVTGTITKGIEYFPIGIVLNLRPRINRDNSEVTLQIETIISSISPESAARLEGSNSGIELAPIVDNRLVETYVRVADGTPFIIGGLLSSDRQETRQSVPLLGNLPLLGRLFSRERVEVDRREVIVVLTPHIVPLQENSFSYLIPKDSDLFNRFGKELFRNAYRVRDDDVWDLNFLQQSQVLLDLVNRIQAQADIDVLIQRQEPFQSLLKGTIPGEEILVRRMLSDIVDKLDFSKEINTDQIFFFEKSKTDGGEFIDRSFTEAIKKHLKTPGKAILLRYETQSVTHLDHPFTYPVATVIDTLVPTDERGFSKFLQDVNPVDPDNGPLAWTIVLNNQDDVKHLHRALILKQLLELNSNLSLSLDAFRPGIQILFPTREDMRNRYHLIDHQVAQLFYETSANQYYPAFERKFNRQTREVKTRLRHITEGRGK